MKRFNVTDILLVAFAAIGISAIHFSQAKPLVIAHEQIIIPPKHLKSFVLGYNESIADSMWLRLIQDFDLCSIGNRGIISTSAEETRRIQALRASGTPICKMGWSYSMLDTITELAPRFEAPYVHGGSALSIIVEDREGAKQIYQKGLSVYPNHKNILLGAAFHSMLELNEPDAAAQYLLKAVKNGAPEWMVSLAANLYTKAGKATLAKVILTDTIETYASRDPNHPFLKRLNERLDEVNKTLSTSER